MVIKEFPDALQQYILHGTEEVNIEYKQTMNWNDRNTKIKIAKAMIAMSNIKSGGVIVVGVEKNGNPGGMTKKDLESFKYDDIADWINPKTTPQVNFKVNIGMVINEDEEKYFTIIQVRESKDLPIIYIGKHIKKIISNPMTTKNIYLRKNALYVRSKSPISSREIADYSEWQDFIELLLERNQESLVKKLPCFEGNTVKLQRKDDYKSKFFKQLTDKE